MPRKKIDVLDVWPKGQEIDLPRFSFGAVCKVLGLEAWRLQKFLDSPRYRLEASRQQGEGKGSRKWFSTFDVYRIGIASFLAKDGFAPKLIAEILERLGDRDLIDFDEHGEVRPGLSLTRTGMGPRLDFFRSGHRPAIKPGGEVFYVLDLGEIIDDIDRRIEELADKKRRG